MATVSVSDDLFHRLAKRAAALSVTVEQLITPLLDQASQGSTPLPTASLNEWQENFDAWMAEVQGRLHRYPPGFGLDDSRESIYQGCGE